MKNIAAKLNKRIVIEQEIRTPDGVGGFVYNWQLVSTLWAEIKISSNIAVNKEIFINDKIDSPNIYRFTIRYVNYVKHTMRIVSDNRTFNIRSVINPDGGKSILYLYAQENIPT